MLREMLDYELNREGIEVIDYNFKSGITGAIYVSSTIKSPVIGIAASVQTARERNGIVAHELGHYRFGAREILAERYALMATMSPGRLVTAYINRGIRAVDDLSEYLEVTPEFISHGFAVYREIYGDHLLYSEYEITFSPFKIVNMRGNNDE